MLVLAATDSGRVEMTKDRRALSLLKRSVEEAAYFVTVHFGSRMGLPFPKSFLGSYHEVYVVFIILLL